MDKIILTVTTCKRLSLFKRTIESFTKNNLDFSLISKIMIFDDCSDNNDLKEMVKICNDLSYNCEIVNVNSKGHIESLNKVISLNEKYIFHIEDDWLFLNKFNFVEKSIDILEKNTNIHQIVFRNFKHLRGLDDKQYNNDFIEKVYNPNFIGFQWPPYTLNPSIQNLNLIKKIGFFEAPNFEENFGKKCFEKGYSLLYSKNNFVDHIGTEISAYILNNTER